MAKVAGRDRVVPVEREYRVGIVPGTASDSESRQDEDEDDFEGSKLGGLPMFLQNDDYPDDGTWLLLLQLDSAQVPFSVNFGDAGVAYVFVDPGMQKARMLWQCA